MLATWGCTTFPKPTLSLDFLGATSLDSRITFSRASTATFFNSLGVLTTASSGVARFDYDPSTLQPRGLLIEEQRTNSIRNNTMQGAVAGTPGTLPTNWGSPGSTAGLTQQVVGTGAENGITYLDLKVSGTPSSSGVFDITIEPATQVAASNGQTWTHSSYVKLASGAATNAVFSVLVLGRDSGGALVAGQVGQTVFVPTTARLTTQRPVATFTMSSASVAYAQPRIRIEYTSGNAIDITLRIGLPQLELGAFATSVIPTTTTALTRNADVATMTGTNFSSWYNASEGTIVTNFAFVGLRSVAGQRIITFDDGSSTNLIAQSAGSTNALISSITDAGSTQMVSTSPATTFSAAATYKMGFAYALNNSVAAVNATIGTVDSACTIPAGITTFRFAASSAASTANCWYQRIAYYPTRLPNATLQALTA